MFISLVIAASCGVLVAFSTLSWFAIRVHDKVMTKDTLQKSEIVIAIAGVIALWSSVLLFLASIALRCSGIIK